jgi:hypothetical protein
LDCTIVLVKAIIASYRLHQNLSVTFRFYDFTHSLLITKATSRLTGTEWLQTHVRWRKGFKTDSDWDQETEWKNAWITQKRIFTWREDLQPDFFLALHIVDNFCAKVLFSALTILAIKRMTVCLIWNYTFDLTQW